MVKSWPAQPCGRRLVLFHGSWTLWAAVLRAEGPTDTQGGALGWMNLRPFGAKTGEQIPPSRSSSRLNNFHHPGPDAIFNDAAQRDRDRMFPMNTTAAASHLRSWRDECRPLLRLKGSS